MSRLDSVIRRLQAQRDCLEMAAGLIDGIPGPVLEFGLGNGRTYDHLREILPKREIYVFDRQIAAHPACIPDDEHMFLGELHDTLPGALERIGQQAALMHFDIGSGDKAANEKLARWIVPRANGLMARGGIAVTDQELTGTAWIPIDLPDGVPAERYFMYRQDAS